MSSICTTIYIEANVFVTHKLLICLSRCKKLWFWPWSQSWSWSWSWRINSGCFFFLLFLEESEAVFSVGIFLRMVPCFPLVLYSNLMISVILLPVFLYRRDCHWESVSSSLHTCILHSSLSPPDFIQTSSVLLFFFFSFLTSCFSITLLYDASSSLFLLPPPSFGHSPSQCSSLWPLPPAPRLCDVTSCVMIV